MQKRVARNACAVRARCTTRCGRLSHRRRFKGERPIGAATGYQSQPLRPCANPPPPPPNLTWNSVGGLSQQHSAHNIAVPLAAPFLHFHRQKNVNSLLHRFVGPQYPDLMSLRGASYPWCDICGECPAQVKYMPPSEKHDWTIWNSTRRFCVFCCTAGEGVPDKTISTRLQALLKDPPAWCTSNKWGLPPSEKRGRRKPHGYFYMLHPNFKKPQKDRVAQTFGGNSCTCAEDDLLDDWGGTLKANLEKVKADRVAGTAETGGFNGW